MEKVKKSHVYAVMVHIREMPPLILLAERAHPIKAPDVLLEAARLLTLALKNLKTLGDFDIDYDVGIDYNGLCDFVDVHCVPLRSPAALIGLRQDAFAAGTQTGGIKKVEFAVIAENPAVRNRIFPQRFSVRLVTPKN